MWWEVSVIEQFIKAHQSTSSNLKIWKINCITSKRKGSSNDINLANSVSIINMPHTVGTWSKKQFTFHKLPPFLTFNSNWKSSCYTLYIGYMIVIKFTIPKYCLFLSLILCSWFYLEKKLAQSFNITFRYIDYVLAFWNPRLNDQHITSIRVNLTQTIVFKFHILLWKLTMRNDGDTNYTSEMISVFQSWMSILYVATSHYPMAFLDQSW